MALTLRCHNVMKRTALVVAAAAALVSTLAISSEASAANYTLWIHGRNSGTATQQGNYQDFSYWGPASTAAGVNKQAVNWNGTGRIADTNGVIRTALDQFCTGQNWCYIADHSAGAAQIGYALALYGTSTRSIPGGGTQVGWNIKWIGEAAAASGGSELADMGYWAVSDYLTTDLRTGTIRPMYNHGTTTGKYVYHFAGASGTLYSGTLPGQDDEAIAYHSALGVSTTGSICNWSDWFCDNYVQISNGSLQWYSSGKSLYANHVGAFVDQSESYNHYTNGNWQGSVSVLRPWIVSYAL